MDLLQFNNNTHFNMTHGNIKLKSYNTNIKIQQ